MTDQPNVVLIHGAFADGSSWSAVIEDLQAKGYEVTAPQFALTSLADDLARLRQVLAWLDGPTIVVGAFLRRADHHRARRRHGQRPRAGLPRRVRARRGESIAALGSDAPPAPALANLIVDQQGFGPLPEDDFVGHFPADVDPVKAKVMHAAQQPVAMSASRTRWGRPPGSRSPRGTWWPPTTRRSLRTPSGCPRSEWERRRSRSPPATSRWSRTRMPWWS
jgi:pimeloyl-ACP methyl ester carboxylesterase